MHRILSIVGNFGIDGLFFPLNLIKKDGLFARSSIADRKMDDVLADFEHVFAAQLIEYVFVFPRDFLSTFVTLFFLNTKGNLSWFFSHSICFAY